MKVRCYSNQCVDLDHVENTLNKRIYAWNIFKIFINYLEIAIIEIDIVEGYFTILYQNSNKKIMVTRDEFFGKFSIFFHIYYYKNYIYII